MNQNEVMELGQRMIDELDAEDDGVCAIILRDADGDWKSIFVDEPSPLEAFCVMSAGGAEPIGTIKLRPNGRSVTTWSRPLEKFRDDRRAWAILDKAILTACEKSFDTIL